ncbi:MAG: RDD family protein [Acidobacteriota bacterium]
MQNPYNNPYSSPAPTHATAGFGIRLAAALIDWVWITAVSAGAYLFAGQQVGAIVASSLGLIVMLFGWAIWGATPGKKVCKLHLSAGTGNQAGIGFPRALARIFGYLLSAIPLGIGFLMIAFSKSNRGLHDMLAGTEVRRQA